MQAYPIGLEGGQNVYNYVDNNPLNSVEDGLLGINEIADWADLGDNLTFGLTKSLNPEYDFVRQQVNSVPYWLSFGMYSGASKQINNSY